MEKIELDIECQSCSGTGLYVGVCERDGAAVICTTCHGSGKEHYIFSYKPFVKMKKRKDVSRVYLSSQGFVITPKPVTMKSGKVLDLSHEGISYKEFIAGKKPKHFHQLGCPMLADQSACHKINGFIDVCEDINGGYFNIISSCKCSDKTKCWERFDKSEGAK